jgi:hypothetical protein
MHIFLSNYWWQESDIWSQASYSYAILWEAFLDLSDSYFLFADLVGFYTHWTYMHIFLSNYWWQRSDIWSQASYRYPISWEAFLDPSDSYFLFADFVDFYAHWIYILYMLIFSRIFLSNYWWQKSDIWSQASYRYPISWEVFFDPSDSYFLFAEERGYHKWALAHSSSCYLWIFILASLNGIIIYCKYLSTFVLQIQIRMWMNSLPKRNKIKIYCQYLHEHHMCKRKKLAKKNPNKTQHLMNT